LPLVAMVAAQAAGLIYLSAWAALLGGLVLLVVDAGLIALGMRAFGRDALAAGRPRAPRKRRSGGGNGNGAANARGGGTTNGSANGRGAANARGGGTRNDSANGKAAADERTDERETHPAAPAARGALGSKAAPATPDALVLQHLAAF